MLHKNNKPLVILTLLLLTFVKPVYAQTNNIRTDYFEEAADKSDFTFKEKYQYFTRTHIEEKTLIKIGFSPVPTWKEDRLVGRLTASVAVENKITPALSVLLELENKFSYTQGPEVPNDYHLGVNGALRYYYAINKRIKEGRSANNFSNNYLSVQSINYIYHRSFTYSFQYGFPESNHLALLWGSQKRMGKLSYIDFNIGPSLKLYENRNPYFWDVFGERIGVFSKRNRTWWVPSIDVNFAIGLGF